MQHRGMPTRDPYQGLSNGGDTSHDEGSSGPRRWQIALLVLSLVTGMWIAVRRVGLAPHDVMLVYAIAGWALMQRRWERDRPALLGESDDGGKQLRFRDFVCEHHQLLSCVVKVRGRSRQENFLAVGVSTLFLLYWKAIFRQKIQMGSLQALALTPHCPACVSLISDSRRGSHLPTLTRVPSAAAAGTESLALDAARLQGGAAGDAAHHPLPGATNCG